jgi:hypothetical protein
MNTTGFNVRRRFTIGAADRERHAAAAMIGIENTVEAKFGELRLS